MTNKSILLKAFGEIGTLEVAGEGDNPKIVEYHRYATKDDDQGSSDSVPWCASFLCYVLESVGIKSTNSKRARSFENLGISVSIDKALPGDIVVFYRNGLESGQGHVGVVVKILKGVSGHTIYCLGGNQNDKVSITKYSDKNVTQIRRVTNIYNHGLAEYSPKEVLELNELANKIISNQQVDKPGSVT